MKICICGGGGLGHVCTGVMASQQDVELNILSGHPDRWQKTITVTDLDGKQFVTKAVIFSDFLLTFAMPLMILLVLICSTKVSEKSDMAKS